MDELLFRHTAVTQEDRERLLELLGEWQLLADLSFADQILWVPRRPDYQTWPEGYVAAAHIRPTTSATVFSHEVVGQSLSWGENPQIDQTLKTGEIIRDTEPTMMGELLIKEETVPVTYRDRTIAIISRYRNTEQMRSASRLEMNYREIAHKIYQMVAEGTFPIQNSIYRSESAPRVGDGLIRLDSDGRILFASPNARSALTRVGWNEEVENHNFGEILESVKRSGEPPRDESWRAAMSGKNLRRLDFENDSGILDLLAIPLIQGGDRIGAIVLLHNVTELRRRDRALVSMDATIREIHHRVKNNLQTVSALLRLQTRRVEDPIATAALNEAVRRVASIALVHETLSTSATETVSFDEVYERIMRNAVELASGPITPTKVGDFGTLDPTVATPLALVITELIHNALEHGLTYAKENHLRVEVTRDKKTLHVKVIDNGKGLPSDFSWDSSSNLGLQIVRTLTENELKGDITLERVGDQTVAHLHFGYLK